jgi:glycoprotein endo-alpha-1,2-mannosidase
MKLQNLKLDKKRILFMAFGLVLPLLATAPARAQDAYAVRASAPAISGVGKRVLALYYPWYGNRHTSRAWLHYEGVNDSPGHKEIATHARFPQLGVYDSADPALIEQHLKEAKSAGIDTLVCSWWGRRDQTDRAIRLLVEQAPKHNMTICIYLEHFTREGDPTAAIEEITYLIEAFGKKPGYLHVNGKPVLFFYASASQSLSADDWAAVLNQLNRRYTPGLIAIGNGSSQSDVFLWDGLHTIDAMARMAGRSVERSVQIQHDAYRAPVMLAHKMGRISIVTVAPGHDDRKFNANARLRSSILADRADGRLYEALWQQAIKDNPDWVLINSFNQWHSGTEIEPSLELGDKYLKLTADYAARFKGR